MNYDIGGKHDRWKEKVSEDVRMLAEADAATKRVAEVIDAVAAKMNSISDGLRSFIPHDSNPRR